MTDTGLFRATAKLPPRRIRTTNRARYVASISRQKSFRLEAHAPDAAS